MDPTVLIPENRVSMAVSVLGTVIMNLGYILHIWVLQPLRIKGSGGTSVIGLTERPCV